MYFMRISKKSKENRENGGIFVDEKKILFG